MRPWRSRARLLLLIVSLIWLCSISFTYWYIASRDKESLHNSMPELLWWNNDMDWAYDEILHCPRVTCRVTNNRKRLGEARAVLFYGSSMKTYDFPLPRKSRQLWGLLHEESPRNVPFVPFTEFLQHFNATSTFSRYSDMPLTTQYLPDASDLSQIDYFSPSSHKEISQFNGELSTVVFIQTDCNTMSGREDYVEELMKHIPVDSYGGCLHNRDLPPELQKDFLNNLFSPALLKFLMSYTFMIAIENGVCEDYITEKYWRPLIAGVIPVYFGSPTIREWQPHNDSAIYIEDFSSPETLAAYLRRVADNGSLFMSYMEHKLNRDKPIANERLTQHLLTRGYRVRRGVEREAESLFHNFECLMCKRGTWGIKKPVASGRHYECPLPPVHAPLAKGKKPKYAADWRSMMGIGRCQAQLLDSYFRANVSFTQQQFDADLARKVDQNLCS